jgi:hypothetical protein
VSGTDAHPGHTLQFLMHILSMRIFANASLSVHNFILYNTVRGALDIVLNPTNWAVVLVKAGRSQVYYGLDLSSAS